MQYLGAIPSLDTTTASMALLTPAIAVALAVLIYRLFDSIIQARRFRTFAKAHGCEPPYCADSSWPWGLDRLYLILTARRHGKDPIDDYFSPPLYEHPTLYRTGLFGTTMFETIDPENVKAILATNFKDWELGEMRHRAFRPVIGQNIFTSDGVFWEHSRTLFRPFFARERINKLECVEESVKALFTAIEERDGGAAVEKPGWSREVNVPPLAFRFTLDNAVEFLFGEKIGSQETFMNKAKGESDVEPDDIAKRAGGEDFAQAVDEATYWMTIRVRLQALGFLGTSKAFRQACTKIKSVSEHFVHKALARSAEQGAHADEKQADLVTALMEQTKDISETRDQALALLFAGRDTTSALIIWTILLLGQHPDVLAKLRRLVIESFSPEGSSVLDFAQLKDCRYLQHVLQETLRFQMIVPLNARVAVRDTVLPTGGGANGTKPIAIRKGQSVYWNMYAMHRRADLWGPDALEYKPERWEDPARSRLLGGGWLFTPFSGGPRICLGQQYALTEAAYCVARLVQRYDQIELAADSDAARGRKVKKTLGTILSPVDLRARFHRA